MHREDVLGLRTGGLLEQRADGPWLRGGRLALPVAEDGFQSRWTARRPLLELDGRPLTALDDVLAAVASLADPRDRDGHTAFAEECRQALATMRLHRSARPGVLAALADRFGPDPADWTGPTASLGFDTLAAYLDHPVHPAGLGRAGLTEDHLRAHAPEFHPAFELRWLVLPERALTVHGTGPLPAWWPTPADLGCTGRGLTLPVHPLTAAPELAALAPGAHLAERRYLTVRPTLSMRTVAVVQDPSLHLKLPLATSTLGLHNRRTIKPGSLVDGAAGQRLLAAVTAREPRFAETVLHADEQCFAHAGHELLAVLLRRQPAGLDEAVTVPLAALLATAPTGRTVLDHLADRFHGGDVLRLYDDLLRLLLDWHTALFSYGIALEAHQQNTSLVLDRPGGRTRLRLLLKDDDGPRINTARLGELASHSREFADARISGTDDRPVTDLFATITGHLCTGSLAFGLAELGRAPLAHTLGLLRSRLAEAVDRIGPAGAPLRAALLDAEELPVKAMVTAGTLLSKERSGAADINKHYTTGPNYLRAATG
ncbi:IucA/IucC family siderophore biosynthesis protein [Kitasatospora sp. NPDC051914]|uniref:IucA/IucC family siderophore biosynthesis protein n=1 Tax=Kitasatospora sp. NPDC051914 TaxID=3154945 RepID=UPI003440A21F